MEENKKPEFKGTKGDWYHSTILHEKIEGAEFSKIYSGKGSAKRVIGTVNATHNEEGYNNLKLIVNAKKLLEAAINLIDGCSRSWDEDDNTVYTDLEDINKLREAIKKALQ